MVTISLFRNSQAQQQKREIKNVFKKSSKFIKAILPPFSYGINELGLTGNNEKQLDFFINR